MQRTLCLLLALALLPGAVSAQSKKRRAASGRAKAPSGLPMVLNRKAALWMLQSAVPLLHDGTRYKSGRLSVPFTHYGMTAARLREDQWVRAAEQLGWVTLTDGRDGQSYTTSVRFTARGAQLFDGSTPGYTCDGGTASYCRFRVAELQAQSITAIRYTSATEAEVLYVWAYRPLPPLETVGIALKAWSTAAIFARYDDGWRITRLGL